MKETTTESDPEADVILNLPSKSVRAPVDVPFKITLAKTTGSKVSASVTLPSTVVWLKVTYDNEAARKETIIDIWAGRMGNRLSLFNVKSVYKVSFAVMNSKQNFAMWRMFINFGIK